MEAAPRAAESTDHLVAHLNALADVAWVVATASRGGIVAVSDTYDAMWGEDLVRSEPEAWLASLLPESRAAARAVVQERSGNPVTVAVGGRAGVRWVRLRALPHLLDPSMTLVHGTDVSDLVLARQHAEVDRARFELGMTTRDTALTEAAARLGREAATREEAERLLLHAEKLEVLGRLTPGIAHDFNNVLAILSGTLHLLRASAADERPRASIERGLRAITSASSLVKSLHTFAGDRAAGGRPLDVNRAITEMAQLLRQATGAQVTLDLRLQAECWVVADPHQLQMALLNLSINARDAMPDGGRLTIGTADVPGVGGGPHGVDVTVTDTGSGMTPEQLARATEPFFTTKGPGRGTGLGLPMVDTFAQSSGGRFILTSAIGTGTTATVRLLAVKPASADVDVPRALVIDRSRHGNATVLVVEDDPLLRPITAAYVRDLGYEVLEAEHAVEAIAIAERTPELGLLLTDIGLPGLDGLALADRLRADRPDFPVVFVTAHAEWARSGGRHVLQKPFDQAALATRILAALQRDLSDDAEAEIARHIAHPALRQFYRRWQSARSRARLPRCADVQTAIEPHLTMAVTVRVIADDPVRCHFEHIGASLLATYSLVPGAEAQVIESVHAAYAACAASGTPSYESIRYRLGTAPSVRFERVIVPCSEANGAAVSHLIGLVSFSNMSEEDSAS